MTDDYPSLGLLYHRSSLDIVVNMLEELSRTYVILMYSSALPLIGVLVGLRILDVKSGKKYIALMKAVGWGNRDILVYTMSYTIIIGLLGGILGAVSLFALSPIIKNYLIIEPSGTIYIKSIVTNMLRETLGNFPDINLALVAPVYGLLIFLVANILVVIYYLRLEPSKILKEV